MTKTEILLDTFKYYEEDPKRRSIAIVKKETYHYPKCLYLSENGNKCALSIRFSEEKMRQHGVTYEMLEGGGASSVSDTLSKKFKISLDEILQDEYIGHDIGFWTDVQRFHDAPGFWDKGITSAYRQAYKDKLLSKYQNQ